MKTVAIIQARMGSTRLPGKVLMKLQGHTVLYHVIERVKQAKLIDEIIVATTTLDEDDVLVEQAELYGVRVFRGSSDNVLNRYYKAALEIEADIVVRITSDCPLIDPNIIDLVIKDHFENDATITTNAGSAEDTRTFPRGLDVEIFSFISLQHANENAYESYQLEHVTPYIYEHNKKKYYKNDKDYSASRWTLDTPEDYLFIKCVYDFFYEGNHSFYFEDVLKYLNQNPGIVEINSKVEQKRINQ